MSEENSKNITKLGSNFVPTFVDHYALIDMNFNGHGFINVSISIPINITILYFLDTKSMVEKFKHKFYIK